TGTSGLSPATPRSRSPLPRASAAASTAAAPPTSGNSAAPTPPMLAAAPARPSPAARLATAIARGPSTRATTIPPRKPMAAINVWLTEGLRTPDDEQAGDRSGDHQQQARLAGQPAVRHGQPAVDAADDQRQDPDGALPPSVLGHRSLLDGGRGSSLQGTAAGGGKGGPGQDGRHRGADTGHGQHRGDRRSRRPGGGRRRARLEQRGGAVAERQPARAREGQRPQPASPVSRPLSPARPPGRGRREGEHQRQ